MEGLPLPVTVRRRKQHRVAESVRNTQKYKDHRIKNTAKAKEIRDRRRNERIAKAERLKQALEKQTRLYATVYRLQQQLDAIKAELRVTYLLASPFVDPILLDDPWSCGGPPEDF